MAKKVTKKEETQQPSKPTKTSNQTKSTAATKKSEKSNIVFWIFFFLFSGGLCFGIKVYLDEEFSKMAKQLAKYEDKFATVMQSQVKAKEISATIHSVSEMKQVLDSVQQMQIRVSDDTGSLRSQLKKLQSQQSSNTMKLESLSQDFQAKAETVDQLKNQVETELIELFSQLNNSVRLTSTSVSSIEGGMKAFQKRIHDLKKGLSSGLKDVQEQKEFSIRVEHEVKEGQQGLSKLNEEMSSAIEDIKQLTISNDNSLAKVSSLEASVSSLSASQANLKTTLNTLEASTKKREAESEQKQRDFELGLSNKISLLEQRSGQQHAEMLKEVANAKQAAATAGQDSTELEKSLKYEFTTAITRVVNEYQHTEDKIKKEAERIKKLEDQLLNQQSGDEKGQFDGVNKELKRVTAELSDITRGLHQVEDDIKQSEKRIDARLSSFTDNLKTSSEQISRLHDEVTDVYAALEDLEKDVAQIKAPSEPAKKEPEQQSDGKN